MINKLEKLTTNYGKDFLVRFSHHSSALEGNTISLAETATIIIDQTLPNNSNITKREYFEVLNHEAAFEYLVKKIENDKPLSIPIIKDIHALLTDRLQHDKGQFKAESNYILGVDFQTTPPERVLEEMNQHVDNLNYRIEIAHTDEEKIKAILKSHIIFEKIHPFSDGNGRAGRMIMNYSLLENNLPPLIIKKENRALYTEILHEAQRKELPSNSDIERFYQFALPLIKEEQNRINAFYKQSQKLIIQDDEKEN